ncbi:hypothetical protein C8R48DRAFT_668296 [Suillus tomentosus]|nr:hypothetical protein C8R48DRAFT_668296 [Suillus tomentosus]
MDDMANDSDDDDESEDKKKKLYQAAREQFIQQTRKSVKDNLEDANIPDQKVYIVSNKTMIGVVKSKQAVKVIDEIELLNDLIQETQTRRARRDAEVDIIMNENWFDGQRFASNRRSSRLRRSGNVIDPTKRFLIQVHSFNQTSFRWHLGTIIVSVDCVMWPVLDET